jgi:hypothetical protein
MTPFGEPVSEVLRSPELETVEHADRANETAAAMSPATKIRDNIFSFMPNV